VVRTRTIVRRIPATLVGWIVEISMRYAVFRLKAVNVEAWVDPALAGEAQVWEISGFGG